MTGTACVYVCVCVCVWKEPVGGNGGDAMTVVIVKEEIMREELLLLLLLHLDNFVRGRVVPCYDDIAHPDQVSTSPS